ncbi:MAG: response regulator [Verrucomicrobia bacterium]|nr:response regulator [Verrucomicrobiota bacterium]
MITPPRILLVEDDENDVFFFKRAFESAGIPINLEVATDGRRALAILRGEAVYARRDIHPMPSLVLLDLKIPYMPGLEVLRQIRASKEMAKVIVIILTSSAMESDLKAAYELGANSYLVKPSLQEDRKELAKLIARYWLEKNQV